IPAHREPFYDGAGEDIRYPVGRDGLFLEFFGYEGNGSPRCLAYAQCKVACVSPHGRDEIPPAGRAGVFHEVRDDANALVSCGLITESGESPGERDIVVYGLRHVDDSEIPLCLPADPVCHEEGTFTTDREEIIYAEPA